MKIITYLAYLFVKLSSYTYRFEFVGEQIQATKETYIFALWHQNIISALTAYRNVSHAMIISPSKDGELVANACRRFGHHPVRGSSSRQGGSALKGMIAKLRSQVPGAITVDGPRGPAHIPKKGIFELSYLAKTPIVPLILYPSSYWSLEKSWDQFRIPKPFSKIYVMHGGKIIPDKADKDNAFEKVSKKLIQELEDGETYIQSLKL
jgi:lysophospholipid acyltransferase (LPLAT)-like uncharacterized protein